MRALTYIGARSNGFLMSYPQLKRPTDTSRLEAEDYTAKPIQLIDLANLFTS